MQSVESVGSVRNQHSLQNDYKMLKIKNYNSRPAVLGHNLIMVDITILPFI